MKRKAVPLAAIAVALLILPVSMRASTNLGMQMSSGSSTATICDNNINFPGCTGNASDLNPALGEITFIGAVGNWASNVTSGFGPPYETLVPLLDISSFSATASAGAGPMTILLSVAGLTGPSGLQTFLNSIGGTNSFAGTTVTTQAWLSNSNIPFCGSGCAGAIALTPLITASGGAFSAITNGSALLGSGPFAITLEVVINTGGQADTTSFDDSLALAEPATLSVLGSGLFGFGLAFRRWLLRA